MNDVSQADRYLLDQIRRGSSDGWTQLVERYQGRLLAFARGKMPRAADAEDLVQDTFVSFLQGLPRFREEAGLETYLFTILRRKIITWFRGKQTNVCFLQDTLASEGEDSTDAAEVLADSGPTASWYVRRDEQEEQQRAALSAALREIIDGYKRKLDFQHLSIVEMLFFCQLRNKDIAAVAGVSENQVALCKHRCLNEIRATIRERPGGESAPVSDALLSRIWREERPSCLKRSTIGAYLLGTLDDAWRDYVSFHLDRLGCAFCRANLADLQEQTRVQPAPAFRDRILQSTIGFLSRVDR
ncbi:MAG: sigma-70 family RNA polymerase sigma factor [Phycisphaerae bacterium]|jgi:RNA polymerase sigma factor (sigma-70 family)